VTCVSQLQRALSCRVAACKESRLTHVVIAARPVSLPQRYAVRMIDLGSIAGLHAHRHELHAYCHRCDRWRVLPLERMVAEGKGSLRLPLRVTCRDCGKVGQLQVRPPMPAYPRANGWVQPVG
jgi:RNase P subunit RPR2